MITDDLIDKAALAGLNAVRAANRFSLLASIEELPRDDTDCWRHEYRAALEAVAADIRNAALEEAKTVAKSHGNTWSGSRDVVVCVQETAVDQKVDDIVADIEALKTKVTS